MTGQQGCMAEERHEGLKVRYAGVLEGMRGWRVEMLGRRIACETGG